MTDGCVHLYKKAPGNSFSPQLGSYCQGNRYGTEKAGGTARPSRTKSHVPGHHSPPASQAGRRVGPGPLAFGLIGRGYRIKTERTTYSIDRAEANGLSFPYHLWPLKIPRSFFCFFIQLCCFCSPCLHNKHPPTCFKMGSIFYNNVKFFFFFFFLKI